ncbi:unnamed protein product, partial [Ectocarpus sp. 4 AP-2014]
MFLLSAKNSTLSETRTRDRKRERDVKKPISQPTDAERKTGVSQKSIVSHASPLPPSLPATINAGRTSLPPLLDDGGEFDCGTHAGLETRPLCPHQRTRFKSRMCPANKSNDGREEK